LAEHPEWLFYDLPQELWGKALGGKYRGQRQKWFALRFLGSDADIRLDLDPHPEFDAWRWAGLGELPGLAVPFKRAIYEALVREFGRFGG
jgi:putative (di)nucleoside polyphosphate hydrolase